MENLRIIIEKQKRTLKIFDDERLVGEYKIALGFSAQGDKRKEGDGKTPEGEFYVCAKNPKSKFYLSLGLSYPNREAALRGLDEKIISKEEHDAILKAISERLLPPQKTALGGEICIHGGGISGDWTAGCAALRDEEMKEIFEAVPIGTEVKILP